MTFRKKLKVFCFSCDFFTGVIKCISLILFLFVSNFIDCYSNTELKVTRKINTIVFRCCNSTEILNIPLSNDDFNGKFNCVHDGNSNWAPVIYSPIKQTFVTPNTIPDDWDFKSSTRPNCRGKLSFISSHQTSPSFVLFDNGSLW